jgi:hypothetical protein
MNKNLLYPVLAGSILLAGCDDKSLNTFDAGDVDSPVVTFAPAATTPALSTPNALLRDPLTGKLSNIPGQADSDIAASLADQDGWGLSTPFNIDIELPEKEKFSTTISQTSLSAENAVVLFQCAKGTSIQLPGLDTCTSQGLTQLVAGVDYSLTASDEGIRVTPLKPFEAGTGFLLGLTDQVKDSFGQSITPSEQYGVYTQTTGTNTQTEQIIFAYLSTVNIALSTATGIDAADFVYSATWTSVDTDAVSLAVTETLASAPPAIALIVNAGTLSDYILAVTGEAPTGDAKAVADATIVLQAQMAGAPNYLPQPTPTATGIEAFWAVGGESPYNRAPQPDAEAFLPIMPVLITIPSKDLTDGFGISDVRVAQFSHGITGVKESMLSIAIQAASKGIALAGIDLPYHGERSFPPSLPFFTPPPEDFKYTITATNRGVGPQFDTDGSSPGVFANLGSLRSARDNVRQSALDQLSLRLALGNLAADPSVTAINANLNTNDIAYIGQSLGSIVGITALGMSELHARANDDDALLFASASLSVPGGQLGTVFGYSDSFSDFTRTSLTASTSFPALVAPALGYTQAEGILLQAATSFDPDEPAEVAAAAQAQAQVTEQLGLDPMQTQSAYGAFVALGYSSFLAGFIDGAQGPVDAGDPVVWATEVQDTPVLVHQVIGDTVIPNSTAEQGYPLGGTAGVLQGLSLSKTSSSLEDDEGIKTFLNFPLGNHGSLSGSPDDPTAAEMQAQFFEFVLSDGTNLTVNDSSVVE